MTGGVLYVSVCLFVSVSVCVWVQFVHACKLCWPYKYKYKYQIQFHCVLAIAICSDSCSHFKSNSVENWPVSLLITSDNYYIMSIQITAQLRLNYYSLTISFLGKYYTITTHSFTIELLHNAHTFTVVSLFYI